MTVAALLGLSACHSSAAAPTTSPAPTPQLAADDVCGFLPRGLTSSIAGSTDLTTENVYLQPPIASCMVYRAGEQHPVLQVAVVDYDSTQLGYIVYAVKQPQPNWLVFPEDSPFGYSMPYYDSTTAGHVGQGAVASYAYGEYFVNVRLYQPTAGRSAVADAAALAQTLPAKLGLSPKHAPYPSYSPSGPTPAPDATIQPAPSTSATSSVPTATP